MTEAGRGEIRHFLELFVARLHSFAICVAPKQQKEIECAAL
jgi:hypothetical protein